MCRFTPIVEDIDTAKETEPEYNFDVDKGGDPMAAAAAAFLEGLLEGDESLKAFSMGGDEITPETFDPRATDKVLLVR